MPGQCSFPTCGRNADGSSSYCIFHKKIYSNVSEVKVQKEIKKDSDKGKAKKQELKKMYPVFLKAHPFCEVAMSPKCTKIATCIHHTKGRGENELFDTDTWKASCTTCNLWVEENHAAAAAAGMKKRRHSKS